jgi:acetolactate synthase-1/2/3 large subunit
MVYSASTAFLEALLEGGIKYIYGNFGSDHPAILESLAEARSTGRKMPEVITAPIEQVGLHLAMVYAHVRPSDRSIGLIGRLPVNRNA